MDHQDVGGLPVLLPGERQQHKPYKEATQHRQGDQSRRQHNAHRNGPEQEGDVHGLLDGSPEADDRQSTHHAQGEDDVAGHRQDQQGSNQGKGDEGHAKAGGVHDAGVALFIDQENKQAQAESQRQGNGGVRQGYGVQPL